jgi:hypothetical protein
MALLGWDYLVSDVYRTLNRKVQMMQFMCGSSIELEVPVMHSRNSGAVGMRDVDTGGEEEGRRWHLVYFGVVDEYPVR